MNSKKFFQIKKMEVKKNQKTLIRKQHRFLAEMTTRKVYPGKHKIEININGQKMAEKEFFIK
jgi:outer membrane usher protein FimD/PapC